VISFALIGTCLDFAAEDRWVTERSAALEKMSAGVKNLWSDPRRRSAIVLLRTVPSILARQWMAVGELL
jgi:hypothetical protein